MVKRVRYGLEVMLADSRIRPYAYIARLCGYRAKEFELSGPGAQSCGPIAQPCSPTGAESELSGDGARPCAFLARPCAAYF